MKKVIFVHDHFFKYKEGSYYSGGGLPAAIWQRYLSVFSCLTVVGRDGGELKESQAGYTLSSVPGVSFRLLPNVSNFKGLLLGNSLVRKVTKTLVSESDGIIARLPSRLGQLFIKEAIRQNKPYAVEVVGCAWGGLWDYGSWKGKLLAPFSAYTTKRMISRAPFALYVTEGFLQRRYPCKGITTFCSNVDIPPVSSDVLELRIKKIGCKKSPLVFGLIGNYSSKYKGIDVAIQALALASRRLPEWELQVLGAGDSSYYQEISEKLGVSDRVRFIGPKASGQPVYEWLDGIDIYLQPSFQEGLPRALIEAMSRGCPALATSIAGIPELLDSNEMVDAGAYNALSEKIASLASDKKNMSNLARRNFEKAQDYYRPVLTERRTEFYLLFSRSLSSKS
ncbi:MULTISPECIES: glycosyltransferase family 4 protein [Pseudomonas]|uniref:glycosyltransferase family 4 protein n=1 Tax=Pseudomonas TaxID=286 RepID=UPI00209A6CB6|nr:glycosyltransferase family 4 protein [Pseudomonas guariconensis]MCO7622420.1 glycosyltransferase family 4 protein [Pseudomonas guariconensis]